MPPITTKSEAKLERLSTELTSYQLAAAAVRRGDFSKAVDEIRSMNRLFDAAMDCGMDYDHADLEGWAAEAVTRFLCAA